MELLGMEGFQEFGLIIDLVGELGQELAQPVETGTPGLTRVW